MWTHEIYAKRAGFLPSPEMIGLKIIPCGVQTSHVRNANPKFKRKNHQVAKKWYKHRPAAGRVTRDPGFSCHQTHPGRHLWTLQKGQDLRYTVRQGKRISRQAESILNPQLRFYPREKRLTVYLLQLLQNADAK